ncbi:MAG: methionyl-tRNA formyltransferase [Alphaproteobacteria bacterium]|nr:methionyl-tRNA formyltransferase [Alphaproteobacteria bacterium]
MKIGYFADGRWAHLALERIVQDDRFDVRFIVPRFDTRDPVLADWAARLKIDFLPLESVNAPENLALLAGFDADIFVSMSFNQILRRQIIEMPKNGFINCHAGALPFYRGRNILNWALINDAKEFGVTVHYIDEGIDTGDIVKQKMLPISDEDNYATLLDRASVLCAEILHLALVDLAEGKSARVPQSNVHPVGFYCGRRKEGDEWIDWNWTSRRIFNFVRAIGVPGPCARTAIDGREIVVKQADLIPSAPEYIGTAGEIVGVCPEGIVVKTADTTILLKVIDSPAGMRLRIGQRFGVNPAAILNDLLPRICASEAPHPAKPPKAMVIP